MRCVEALNVVTAGIQRRSILWKRYAVHQQWSIFHRLQMCLQFGLTQMAAAAPINMLLPVSGSSTKTFSIGRATTGAYAHVH
jgi:hypothetical protein